MLLFLASAGPAAAVGNAGRVASPDHVVVPTGTFPTDRDNVRAAFAAGGTVLLRALNSAGVPMAFNFGASGAALIRRDVAVFGERVHGAVTTVQGGRTPFFANAPGAAVSIKSIRFERNRGASIVVIAADRVEIEENIIIAPIGIPLGRHRSAASGIQVEGNPFAPGFVTGTVLIRGNSIADLEAQHANGIVVIGISASTEVVGNEVRGTQTGGILATNNSAATRIADNLVVPGVTRFPDRTNPANEFGNGIVAVGPARHVISQNSVLLEDSDADGILVLVFDHASSDGSLVDHNDIKMVNSVFGGVSLVNSVSHSLVTHNKISGRAATALAVLAFDPESLAEGNVFQANNLSKFDATLADVFLDANTRDSVVVGDAGAVIDLGTNNRITGFDHARGGVPQGQRLSDVLKQTQSLRRSFEDASAEG